MPGRRPEPVAGRFVRAVREQEITVASLGTFGAARREYEPPAEPDTFELRGATFSVVGEVPGMVELAVSAALSGKVGGLDGSAAVFEALRYALTAPERKVDGKTVPADAGEWERFQRLATETYVESDWLTAIVLNIIAAQAGRPTERPSTSSDGQPPTSTSSNSSSSDSPDSPAFRPVDEVLAG